MMGARSRFVFSGTSAGGGHEGVWRARRARDSPEGPRGTCRTAARSTALARAAFWVRTEMTCSTVTASWSGVPAVVVGDHGQGGVADLRLPGELGFLQVGHADEVGSPTSGRGSTRPGSRTAGPPCRRRCPPRGRSPPPLRRPRARRPERRRAEGAGEAHVAHEAVPEERGVALERPVHELVGDDHVERLVLLLERAHGGDGEDALHPQRLQGPEVGLEGQLGGEEAVAAGVPGEEGDRAALERPEHEGVGGLAEGRVDRDLADVLEALHLVEAAAPDDADARPRVAQPPPSRSAGNAKDGSRWLAEGGPPLWLWGSESPASGPAGPGSGPLQGLGQGRAQHGESGESLGRPAFSFSSMSVGRSITRTDIPSPRWSSGARSSRSS